MSQLTVTLDTLLHNLVEHGGSDLHLRVGLKPLIRVRGELEPLPYPTLEPEHTEQLMFGIMNAERKAKYLETHEMDMAYSVKGLARFRVNVLRQQGFVGAVLRCIPFKIKTVDDLGLPPVVSRIVMMPRGLVLVTGPTGWGKSTTLAAMIRFINEHTAKHIITIEDPIEFVHDDIMSIIQQRELGEDTRSFGDALKHVLRQAPDVILVGEMRDLETIHLAITAAETGHLVFGTLHTTNAAQTMDRAIDVFPPDQQQQVRMQLSVTLLSIVSQTLLPTADGKGRVAAFEILVATPAIRSLIREGKTHQLPTELQSGGELGMQSLDAHLIELVRTGSVTTDGAIVKCGNPAEFDPRLAMSTPPPPGGGPPRR